MRDHYRYTHASDSALVTEVQCAHLKSECPNCGILATISKAAATSAPMLFGIAVDLACRDLGVKLPFNPFYTGVVISVLVWMDSCGWPMLRSRRYLRRDAVHYDGRQVAFEAGPLGFKQSSELGSSEVSWAAVRDIFVSKRAIAMWVGKNLYCLPKSVFRDEAEQSAFLEAAQTWMGVRTAS